MLCATTIPKDVMKHVGRWMWGIFNRVYAAKLLLQPLLTQAGFMDNASSLMYQLCGGRARVPQELKDLVWPWVDKHRWDVRKVSLQL